MDELLAEVAELPCANTPLYAARQLGRLDYEPEHPAEGETLCFSECHACRARVRAIELLKTHKDEQKAARWNTIDGAVVSGLVLQVLEARVDDGDPEPDTMSVEDMQRITAGARSIADAALKVDP